MNSLLNVNSPRSLLATLYLGVVGPCVYILQPGFVQGLVAYYNFDEQQAGYIASAETWGIAVTTLVIALGAHNYNWRVLLRFSVIMFTFGNLASLMTQEFVSFSILRFIAGIGGGGIISLAFTIIGLTKNPDRNFGCMNVAVLSYSALGIWVMPVFLSLVGLKGLLVFFTVFTATGWFCIQNLPSSGKELIQVNDDALNLKWVFKAVAVVSMSLFFFAQGCLWPYLFLIGTDGGVSEQAVANSLMISLLFAIAGACSIVIIGTRFGRAIPLAVGILGSAAVLSTLFGTFSTITYAIAVSLLNFAMGAAHPYLLASMASFDDEGRVVTFAVSAQTIGLAVGSAVSAYLLGMMGDYGGTLVVAMSLFLISYLLILIPLTAHSRYVKNVRSEEMDEKGDLANLKNGKRPCN